MEEGEGRRARSVLESARSINLCLDAFDVTKKHMMNASFSDNMSDLGMWMPPQDCRSTRFLFLFEPFLNNWCGMFFLCRYRPGVGGLTDNGLEW